MKRKKEMDNRKKVILLILSILLLICVSYLVSSAHAVASIGGKKTIVTGKVYYGSPENPVVNADVLIKCKHNGITTRKKAQTDSKGEYFQIYLQEECSKGDKVYVKATSPNGISGENIGEIGDTESKRIDIGIIDVPLVPEFGVLIGGLTILGALGVFFLVRKR